jgi:hypothetical protein
MPLRGRQISRESGRFSVPAPEFRAAASLSLGKLKSRTRPHSAVKAAYLIRGRPRRAVQQRRYRAMSIEFAS